MKIAAIDPGTRVVGYCVLEWRKRRLRVVDLGAVRPKSRPAHRRLAEIQAALERLFARHRPEHVAVERAFVGRNAASALRLAEGRGVALAAAARAGAEVFEYAASETKRAVTSNGRAVKSDVQRSIQLLLGLTAPPAPDAADAAALALCHAARKLGW